MKDNLVTKIDSVIRETEKAVLVEVNGDLWLPKSQVEIVDTDFGQMVILPAWLYWKNKPYFTSFDGKMWYTTETDFRNRAHDGEIKIH